MQKWKKLGLIFKPDTNLGWSKTHCQMPVPFKLKGHDCIYRVIYAARNLSQKPSVGYFDIDLEKIHVIDIGMSPSLTPSQDQGFFDRDGVFISSIYTDSDDFRGYYVGRVNGEYNSFFVNIGLAISHNEGALFSKFSTAPIMQRSQYDPWCVGSCFVLKENELWRMWYSSGTSLSINNGILSSVYDIKYAESEDGIEWKREGLISIAHFHPGETNIARPWILKEDGIYKAWFSYNCGKQGYRIGYAESRDGGYTFERMDHLAGITVSNEPWESEAVAYPAVIVHKGKKYMFYNGNRFGKDGIALAIQE